MKSKPAGDAGARPDAPRVLAPEPVAPVAPAPGPPAPVVPPRTPIDRAHARALARWENEGGRVAG